MRLIDADAIEEKAEEVMEKKRVYVPMMLFMEQIIDQLPTIAAEPVKHGHWIGVEYDDNDLCFVIKCSECGGVFEKIEDGNWNYCPNCGAKMERRKE